MLYTAKISQAIKFAIQVHEIDQKQKRKGKDIAYITHPLTVGIILTSAGASEDVVAAGILHDTIEDSVANKKVTPEILEKQFGKNVADLVISVTETNKKMSWAERKQEALAHIETFSHESCLVKSADIISNCTELVEDYNEVGEKLFDRFGAPKEKVLGNYFSVIEALIIQWDENPLVEELFGLADKIQMLLTPQKTTRFLYLDYYDSFARITSLSLTAFVKFRGKEEREVPIGNDLVVDMRLSGVTITAEQYQNESV